MSFWHERILSFKDAELRNQQQPRESHQQEQSPLFLSSSTSTFATKRARPINRSSKSSAPRNFRVPKHHSTNNVPTAPTSSRTHKTLYYDAHMTVLLGVATHQQAGEDTPVQLALYFSAGFGQGANTDTIEWAGAIEGIM